MVVEAQNGCDVGIVTLSGPIIANQLKRDRINPETYEFRKIYRKARANDIEKWQEAISREHKTMIRSRQMAADLGLNMKIGDVEGFMNICLPFFTLEDVMDKLSTKYWYSVMQENRDEHYGEHIETMIRKVDVPVKAILGRSTISVSDFLGLQVGDCIRLDTKVDNDMEVYVGNIRKFTALPGANADAYAVRITSIIREEE